MIKLIGVVMLLAARCLSAAEPSAEDVRYKQLESSEWERSMRESPTWASSLGDRRYNDQWTNLSPEAISQSQVTDRAVLEQLQNGSLALPPSRQVVSTPSSSSTS